MSRLDDKKPLPPEVLVGALQDKIDTGPERVRPARTVRCTEKHSEAPTPRTQRVMDGIIRDHNDEASRYGPSAWAYLEDHARQLERELAEYKARAERAEIAQVEASMRDTPVSAMAPLNAGDRLYYRNALDRAAYALFQIKRMVDVPRHVIDFAVEAHSEACKALDDDGAIDGTSAEEGKDV